MNADCQPPKFSRSWIFLAVRWAAALLILGILLYLLPVAPLRSALSRVPISRFIAVLLIYFVAVTGGITKWHAAVNSAGAQLSFAASAQCYTSGLFGALFLPSIIGGDVARLAVGISRSARPAAVVTGNVADRFLDVAAQLTLMSLGLLLLPGSLPAPLQAPAKRVLFAGVLAAAIFFSLVAALRRPLLRGRSVRIRRRLAQLRHAIRAVSRRPLAAAFWLAPGNFRAGHLCSTHRSSRRLLRTSSAVARVALRLAIGQNCRGHAHHARRHWSSRGGTGGSARAVWRAGRPSSCNRHRLGGRDHHRRPSRRTDGVSFAVLAVSPTGLVAFPSLPAKFP